MSTPPRGEVYVSVDVEADGPYPGPHSMLSIGAAAYLADKTLLATFSANLQTLEGASGHPVTMAWWATQQKAWEACRKDLEEPKAAMERFALWVRALPGRPVFVAWPAGFDFTWVYWYSWRFLGESPFGFQALDVKSYALAMLGGNFKDTVKGKLPRDWFDPLPHTHVALDDALAQGALFCNMLAVNRKRLEGPRD